LSDPFEKMRPYTHDDVVRLQSSVVIQHTLATKGALTLRKLLQDEGYTHALGAVTGNQAVQMVKAGLPAIYVSGWQTAADANVSGETFPDQSLYPSDSVPQLVRRINRALARADNIERVEGQASRDWFVPIIADAEAGFGGHLNAFELMRWMIEAGAAAVHFEDQLSSEKKCGHLGGKCLVPTSQFIRTLVAARLASDVEGVPTVLIARTDADAARLLTTDIDPVDAPFITGERTIEGFYRVTGGLEMAIARAKAYAPYADVIWCEMSYPDIEAAKKFAEAVKKDFPDQILAMNCSPSFHWKKKLDDASIARFQRELNALGYKFQFITLAGFHSLNHGMFELALDYQQRDMSAYVELQEREFMSESDGYAAVRHQREVGTSYFDAVSSTISSESSTLAMIDSTESEQFSR